MFRSIKLKVVSGFISVCALVLIFAPCADVSASEITPNSQVKAFYNYYLEDTAKMDIYAAREAYMLKEKDLIGLSSEELQRAVLEYPLMMQITFYDGIEHGFDVISEHCTALRLLLKRSDVYKVVSDALTNLEATRARVQGSSFTKTKVATVLRGLKGYFDGYKFWNDIDYFDEEVQSSSESITPQDNSVDFYTSTKIMPCLQ